MNNRDIVMSKNKQTNKKNEMELQLITVAKNITIASTNILSSACGKLIIFCTFLSTTFLAIKPLIIITTIFVLIDFILGLTVTIYKKGWSHVLSARMRDSLVKYFFYIFLITGLFLIETQLVDGYYLTSKVIFAVITGIELLSISANFLILFPNMPILKLFNRLLVKEMAKKLEIAEDDLKKDLDEK